MRDRVNKNQRMRIINETLEQMVKRLKKRKLYRKKIKENETYGQK